MKQIPTGLIVAMAEELAVVLKDLQHPHTIRHAGLEFHSGTYFDHPVVAVVCGVGKVNAALCAQLLITHFQVGRLINIGIAGGLDPELVPGDIVIADRLVQHDVDVSALGLPPGQIYRHPEFDFPTDPAMLSLAQEACALITDHRTKVGCVATGDQFIADNQKARYIYQQFGALACEMESASIAQVCRLNKCPFIVIRSLSDNANSGAHMDFDAFLPIAVQNSSILLKAMFQTANNHVSDGK